jgi:predicted ferric reductase
MALMLLMSILSVTFLAKWRYQILKFMHQILGFAFFFGALHSFLIPSDISGSAVLMWYMLPLTFLSLLAYGYRTLFGTFLVSRYTYVVKAVNRLDATVTEVVMYPEGRRMHYAPGQFVFISFSDGGIESEVHPFSISSAPTEAVLRITIKALGDYTKTIQNLQVGATAKIEGPFGSFTYLRGSNLSQIWIAGGIGITPFLNMARNLRVNTHTGHLVDFYYSAKTKEEMVFLEELQCISAEYPNLHIIPFNADEKGFLNMDVVQKLSGELLGKDIFVCGPPPMMRGILAQCRMKGIPRNLVHSEEFKLL